MKPRGFSAPQGSKVLRGSLICLLLFKITCCSNSASGTRDGGPGKPEKCRNDQDDKNEVKHDSSSCISHCSKFEFAMFYSDQCKCRNEHPAGDINKDGCMAGKEWWEIFSTKGTIVVGGNPAGEDQHREWRSGDCVKHIIIHF